MTDEVFSQLMESLRQADAIFKGTVPPSRRFEVVAPVQPSPPRKTHAANDLDVPSDGAVRDN